MSIDGMSLLLALGVVFVPLVLAGVLLGRPASRRRARRNAVDRADDAASRPRR